MTSLRHSLQLSKGGVISLVGAGGKTSLMFRLARELSGQGDAVLSTTTTKIYTPGRTQSSVVMVSESAGELAREAGKILRHKPHITAGSRRIAFQNKLKGFAPEIIDAIRQSGTFRWIVVEADGAAGKSIKAPAGHEPVIAQSTKWVIGIVGLGAVGKPLTEKWAFRPQLVSKITGLAPGEPITEAAVAEVLTNANGIMKGYPAQAQRVAFLNQAESQKRLETGRRIAEMICSQRTAGLTAVLIGQTLYEPFVREYYSVD
jgi:probable selenium-dependent hydroxylase accessory protein YqeC